MRFDPNTGAPLPSQHEGERLTFQLPKPTPTSPFGVELLSDGNGAPVRVSAFPNPVGVGATSGLQLNDIVLSINGVAIHDDKMAVKLLKEAKAGTVAVEVVRPSAPVQTLQFDINTGLPLQPTAPVATNMLRGRLNAADETTSLQNNPEYEISDCGFQCANCGGHQKLMLTPDSIVITEYIPCACWPLFVCGPCGPCLYVRRCPVPRCRPSLPHPASEQPIAKHRLGTRL